jgi:ubiquinone/menaquinone biosynthesis C-methylase UbiE
MKRSPHAALDDQSRLLKARKIEAQLRAERRLEGADILDIGCGNGVIARHLARVATPGGSVSAVDVVDQRTTFDDYSFFRVSGTALPFGDESFDVVLSNHTIEHVGGRQDQSDHLVEIRRVLRSDGICYLAVPNRWRPVEAHFHLPFLAWLPKPLRTPYVRLARRGAYYDCDIPTGREIARLVHEAGFERVEITVGAFPLLLEIEEPGRLKRALLRTPPRLATIFQGVLPTRMYILRKASSRA